MSNRTDCTCQPGNNANGWHEARSEKCYAEERAEWARIIREMPKVAPETIAKRRSTSRGSHDPA